MSTPRPHLVGRGRMARPNRPETSEPLLAAMIAEGRRLFDEAEERLAAGEIRAATSSMSAARPLCMDLVERLDEFASVEEAKPAAGAPPTGMYL